MRGCQRASFGMQRKGGVPGWGGGSLSPSTRLLLHHVDDIVIVHVELRIVRRDDVSSPNWNMHVVCVCCVCCVCFVFCVYAESVLWVRVEYSITPSHCGHIYNTCQGHNAQPQPNTEKRTSSHIWHPTNHGGCVVLLDRGPIEHEAHVVACKALSCAVCIHELVHLRRLLDLKVHLRAILPGEIKGKGGFGGRTERGMGFMRLYAGGKAKPGMVS